MKYIKLNNGQAKKIAGKYSEFQAEDPRFIKEDFFIVILENLHPIAKKYIEKLLSEGKVKEVDMSKMSDPDTVNLQEVFKETEKQADTRVKKKVEKWDYTKIEVKEL